MFEISKSIQIILQNLKTKRKEACGTGRRVRFRSNLSGYRFNSVVSSFAIKWGGE